MFKDRRTPKAPLHIEMRARDKVAAGMSPDDAVADAMRRFGDFSLIRSNCEEIRKERMEGRRDMFIAILTIFIGAVLIGLVLFLVAAALRYRSARRGGEVEERHLSILLPAD
jgi:hypothetical protein